MIKRFYLLVTLFFSVVSWGKTEHSPGLWLGYFNQENLSNAGRLHIESQLRYNLDEGRMNQSLVRFGYLYNLDQSHQFGLLFAYADSDSLKEYRPTFQHQYFHQHLTMRQRLEYRKVEEMAQDSWRYRLLLRSKVLSMSKELGMIVWNEVFINLGHEQWTGNRTFERNRFFFGPRHRFKNFDLEWGYLNQIIPRKGKESIEHLLVGYFYF
ncbi:MAG: DUF2490 domain-containing protein [Bacteriovoracaceae bacterium]